jgi:hypothetical protein
MLAMAVATSRLQLCVHHTSLLLCPTRSARSAGAGCVPTDLYCFPSLHEQDTDAQHLLDTLMESEVVRMHANWVQQVKPHSSSFRQVALLGHSTFLRAAGGTTPNL